MGENIKAKRFKKIEGNSSISFLLEPFQEEGTLLYEGLINLKNNYKKFVRNTIRANLLDYTIKKINIVTDPRSIESLISAKGWGIKIGDRKLVRVYGKEIKKSNEIKLIQFFNKKNIPKRFIGDPFRSGEGFIPLPIKWELIPSSLQDLLKRRFLKENFLIKKKVQFSPKEKDLFFKYKIFV